MIKTPDISLVFMYMDATKSSATPQCKILPRYFCDERRNWEKDIQARKPTSAMLSLYRVKTEFDRTDQGSRDRRLRESVED
jgi:hypothetical protein